VLEWFGAKAIAAWTYVAALGWLVAVSARELASPGKKGRGEALRVITRQILFTGVDALPVVSGIALMIGIIIITQAGTQLPKLGAGGLVGNIIVVVVIRELGPLLTAFIVVGRSGTAITTELGNMRVAREVVALELMGIRVTRFIVMPRMVGMVLSLIALTLYFDVVSVVGGFFVARIVLTVPFDATNLDGKDVGSLPRTALRNVLNFTSAVEALNKNRESLKNIVGKVKPGEFFPLR